MKDMKELNLGFHFFTVNAFIKNFRKKGGFERLGNTYLHPQKEAFKKMAAIFISIPCDKKLALTQSLILNDFLCELSVFFVPSVIKKATQSLTTLLCLFAPLRQIAQQDETRFIFSFVPLSLYTFVSNWPCTANLRSKI